MCIFVFEHIIHHGAGLWISFGSDHSRVFVGHFGEFVSHLIHDRRNAQEHVARFEPGDGTRDAVLIGDKPVGLKADYSADMTGIEKSLDCHI